jgi:hypothetical protein
MAQGLFALAGVLLGGLITIGVELVKRRFDNRVRQRTAARILAAELRLHGLSVERALLRQDVGMVDLNASAIWSVWRQHRMDLAARRDRAWTATVSAVLQLTRTQDALSEVYVTWSDAAEHELAELGKRMTTAIAELDDLNPAGVDRLPP